MKIFVETSTGKYKGGNKWYLFWLYLLISTGSPLDNIYNENFIVSFFLNNFIRLQSNNLLKL
jgi:hypothetical protein